MNLLVNSAFGFSGWLMWTGHTREHLKLIKGQQESVL